MNARIIPITMVIVASISKEMFSVVNPFNELISSDKILERIPGALSLESNQEIDL